MAALDGATMRAIGNMMIQEAQERMKAADENGLPSKEQETKIATIAFELGTGINLYADGLLEAETPLDSNRVSPWAWNNAIAHPRKRKS